MNYEISLQKIANASLISIVLRVSKSFQTLSSSFIVVFIHCDLLTCEISYQFEYDKIANKTLWINSEHRQSLLVSEAENLNRDINNSKEMASESVLRVLIFMSVVMSSFCYVYIIPGEMGKSKGRIIDCFKVFSWVRKPNQLFVRSRRLLLLQRHPETD